MKKATHIPRLQPNTGARGETPSSSGAGTHEGGGSTGAWLGSLGRTQMGPRKGEQVLKKQGQKCLRQAQGQSFRTPV